MGAMDYLLGAALVVIFGIAAWYIITIGRSK